MNDLHSIMATYEKNRQEQAALNEANKNTIFDALAAANITKVVVDFDGEGDSGQIDSIVAFIDEELTKMPVTTVTIGQIQYGKPEPFPIESTLEQAIETLCYDYLDDMHGGWENNDGAFGEFTLDAVTRTIELEFSARFTDCETYTHTF